MKEHEWPIPEAEGMEIAVRVGTELVEVSNHRKPPWRRW
jgi:translation initiation factor IF-3